MPLIINGEEVKKVSCFKFLGILITGDLKCEANTTAIVKKAQQWLYFIRKQIKCNLSAELFKNFYQCSIESVITYCITEWYANCLVKDKMSPSWVIRSACESH